MNFRMKVEGTSQIYVQEIPKFNMKQIEDFEAWKKKVQHKSWEIYRNTPKGFPHSLFSTFVHPLSPDFLGEIVPRNSFIFFYIYGS